MRLTAQARPKRNPFAVIVDEALSAVLAEDCRADVLFDALTIAGLSEIPDRPASMRIFVEGALFTALSRQLDVSDALELTTQIRGALELALATDEERPTSAIREKVQTPKRALVATKASLVVFLLQDMIGDQLDVVALGSEEALLEHAREARGPVLVVVDRKHACVDASACAALREALGADSTIVWWGGDAHEHAQVEGTLEGGPRAIACSLEMRLADLGDLCRGLLER